VRPDGHGFAPRFGIVGHPDLGTNVAASCHFAIILPAFIQQIACFSHGSRPFSAISNAAQGLLTRKCVNVLAAVIVMVYSVLWYLLFSVVGNNQRRVGLLRLTMSLEDKSRRTLKWFNRKWAAVLGSLSRRIAHRSLKNLALDLESPAGPLAINALVDAGSTAASRTQAEEYSGI
jgi:hypothetical protein